MLIKRERDWLSGVPTAKTWFKCDKIVGEATQEHVWKRSDSKFSKIMQSAEYNSQ